MWRTDSLEKPLMLGKIEGGRRRGRQDEMVRWYHWLNGHKFESTPGVSDGQGSLVCCSPWGHKESDMTKQVNWTELNAECQRIEVCACMLYGFSRVRLFATPWTVACQAPLPMGFSRQEYWRGCHGLLQGIFPTQGSNPRLLCLLHYRLILYCWATRGGPRGYQGEIRKPSSVISAKKLRKTTE